MEAGSRFWIVATSAILVVVLGAFAWFHLVAARIGDDATPGASAGRRSYREAQHLDVASARLEASAGRTVLRFGALDVPDGEGLSFTRRDGVPYAKHAWVFVDRVDRRGTGNAAPRPGALEAALEPTGPRGAHRVRIDLPASVDRVTVVDQRWEKGRWQGFEVALTGSKAR